MLLILAGDVHPNPGPSDRMKSSLSFCHANIRSLKNKLEYIKCDLADNYDVITLSETWLTREDKSETFSISGFQGPIRKDRSFGSIGYGGVLLWVRNCIAYKRRKDLESPLIEGLWVELRQTNNKFLMCILYRTKSNSDATFWNSLQLNIENVMSLNNSNVILVGDLNSDFGTEEGKHLKTFCKSNNLTIHVHEPTRITPLSASVLDQIISTDPNFISNVNIEPPIAGCDHSVISATCSFKIIKQKLYK